MIEYYSIESRKGGVGKTTIALNLARALTRRKCDVLLIDCDITGTPITKAALHSAFWHNEVVVSKKDDEPYNLIDFFENVYLNGENKEKEIIEGFDYNPRRIHLLGSEIYDSDGRLIIDPRNLMDDLHSYWFMDFIKSLVIQFCESTKQPQKAIIFDNSPGYVGIGRSLREWMTQKQADNAKFILVSSLDEQDVESTIKSAAEIKSMMTTDRDIRDYVKIIINKVPEDLIAESGGYDFLPIAGERQDELVKVLFPLDKRGYPQNIIKYDSSISGQFIEARLLPKVIRKEGSYDLESAFRTFEKKAASFDQKQDQFADISSMDYYYKGMLRALSNNGYVRMSKSLKGELMPINIVKNVTDVVGRLGNMALPDAEVLHLSKDFMNASARTRLFDFIDGNNLAQYTPVLYSLFTGLYKVAGYERKDANLFQLFNLNVMLSAFYLIHDRLYNKREDYRDFLKREVEKKNKRSFDIEDLTDYEMTIIGNHQIPLEAYVSSLLKAHFAKFYQAMCNTLIRMMDCSRDYGLILDACKNTISSGAKMMSEDLIKYLKAVVSQKTSEPESLVYKKLVDEPYEMKAIQKVLVNQVLGK